MQFLQVRANEKRKTPEDPTNTPQKEVAFSQQHSQLKEGGRAKSLLLVFKNVVFSWFEVMKVGPCHNADHPFQSHPSLFFPFFLCILDMKRRKKKNRIRLKCLLLSMISETVPTQTSALCLFSDCHALFVFRCGTCQQTSTHTLAQFVGREWKEGEQRMERKGNEGILLVKVMYNKVLSACESQTHCVLQVPINSVL